MAKPIPITLLPPDLQRWLEIIQYVKNTKIGVPKRLDIDLSVAHYQQEYNITGNYFYVIRTYNPADDSDQIGATLEAKFNETGEPNFRLESGMGFKTPYYRFFITNTAQANTWATILYGTLSNEFLEIIDKRSNIMQTAILDDISEFVRVLKYIPVGATEIIVDGYNAGATSQVTLYTVPANRTFYITESQVAILTAATGGQRVGRLIHGTSVFCISSSDVNVGNPNSNTQGGLNHDPHIPVPAGVAVISEIRSTANVLVNGHSYAMVKGYLV